jgi:hypothetical protein
MLLAASANSSGVGNGFGPRRRTRVGNGFGPRRRTRVGNGFGLRRRTRVGNGFGPRRRTVSAPASASEGTGPSQWPRPHGKGNNRSVIRRAVQTRRACSKGRRATAAVMRCGC